MNLGFFYCYNKRLFKFLKLRKGIDYVCTGLSQSDLKQFWQFQRTADLDRALEEYKAMNVVAA